MKEIYYSEKYYDANYEYRHVILPKSIACELPKNKLFSETEWRRIGVQMSPGWVHYAHHMPEPHVLLFRRPLSHPNATGPPQTQQQQMATEVVGGNNA